MPTDEPYWDWMDAQLKQELRAVGGEPCVICGNEISSKTHWKQRDRHVCSPRCNSVLIRRWKKSVERGEAPSFVAPVEFVDMTAREANREPRLFQTLIDAEFPYESARSPVSGDVIERNGQQTAYVPLSQVPYQGTFAESVIEGSSYSVDQILGVVHLQSGGWTLWFRHADGSPSRLHLGQVIFGQYMVSMYAPIELKTGTVYCNFEIIRDADETGEFTWEALAFSSIKADSLWTPARTALSLKRARSTRARAAYQARMRALGTMDADADRVDSLDVYERDGWICGICHEPVTPGIEWPDPWMATLDHIKPVSRQGEHTMDNLQTAHWGCNLKKGNGP